MRGQVQVAPVQLIDGLSQFGDGSQVGDHVVGRFQPIGAGGLGREDGARLNLTRRVAHHQALYLVRFVGIHDQDAVHAAACVAPSHHLLKRPA
jgi:hypothetical protein